MKKKVITRVIKVSLFIYLLVMPSLSDLYGGEKIDNQVWAFPIGITT